MKKIKKSTNWLWAIFLFSFLLVNCAYAQNDLQNKIESQREDFKKAEKAIKANDLKTYKTLAKKLKDYPLAPYLEFEKIHQRLKNTAAQNTKAKLKPTSLANIQKLAQQYQSIPLHDKLLYKWLSNQGEEKNWSNFLKGYPLLSKTAMNTKMECYHARANYALFKSRDAVAKAIQLWMVGSSQPAECDTLFKTLLEDNKITQEHIMKRYKLTMTKRNYKLAKFLRTKMTPSNQKAALVWEKIIKTPSLIEQKNALNDVKSGKTRQKILVTVFGRYARDDAEKALNSWDKIKNNYALTFRQKNQIQRDIAVFLAYQNKMIALKKLEELPNRYLDSEAKEWKVRTALKQRRWEKAIHYINQLEEPHQSKKIWQYWLARCYENLNQRTKAKEIYKEIANERSYYAFLASQKLGKSYTLNHQPIAKNNINFNSQTNQTLQRIKELIALNRPVDARREWHNLIESSKENDKVTLSLYAHQNQWHFMAIYGLSKSESKDDLKIRFPLAYKNIIRKQAKQNHLDSAWIFALTRQESGFGYNAVSPVGAVGLMQLMPKTAQFVARKYHKSKPSTKDLTKPELNVKLGTTYLSTLNKSLKHPVLATAAYNAGPHRIKTWLPNNPMDADIWIENIPYAETREYVKNILTFMSIYKNHLGVSFKMSSMMEPITEPRS